MTRPVVVVLGGEPTDPPPGITAAARHVDLRYAAARQGIADAVVGADGIFHWKHERAWLEEAVREGPDLRWVQTISDGVDTVLFPALVESDIAVTNARGVFDASIAEWVIGAMLSFTARILIHRDAQALSEWTTGTTERLGGSRLVVVGPGPIGRAVGVRAKALGMRLGAVGRSARADDLFGRIAGADRLVEAVAEVDFVLDALPLTTGTRHLFDDAVFRAMAPTARFLNVGRGGTVDQPALIRALQEGAIAGAALDVFEEEPLPEDSPFWGMAQVLISPHMCGNFDGWHRAVVEVFVDNCRRFARGEPLRNVVDKTAGFGVG